MAALSARRMAGEPLEHVVGWVAFAGRRLAVGPGVFVPRRRSEFLAAAAVAAAAPRAMPVVLEAYCGVAPIAATVRRWLPDAQVYACDTDRRALGYAARNLGGDENIHVGEGLSALPAEFAHRFDVIAAVVPYVPDAALALMPHEAIDHEPHLALLGGAAGLDHLRTIVEQATGWLTDSGELLLECHRTQEPELMAHAHAAGFTGRYLEFAHSATVVLWLTR